MATETHQSTAAETTAAVSAGLTAEAVFGAWLDRLTVALEAADVAATTALLARDCWWRDLLALTGDLGVYRGREKVAAMLGEHLVPGSVTNLRLVTEFGPRHQGDNVIE